MRLRVFSIVFVLFFSTSSFASPDSVEVIDGGFLHAARAVKVQKVPMGQTRVVIERNEAGQISHIEIEQNANITRSGVAIEITDFLADLVEGDSIAEALGVRLHQEINLSGEVDVRGIRFAGRSARNEKLLRNIELDVIQNVARVGEGQVWTAQSYAMAHIVDYAGLQEIAMAMKSGVPSRLSLGEVAKFPGAEGVYKKINIGGKIGPGKGSLNHIAMEKALAIFKIQGTDDCSPYFVDGPKTLQ